MLGCVGILNPVRENFERGYEVGGHLTVYREGACVVDVVFGYTDLTFTKAYAPDTLQLIFSSTKFVESMAMLLLVDKGLLHVDAPIAKYWPEFAQNGKENVTLGDLMSHAGGLHGVCEPIPLDVVIENGDRFKQILEKTPLDERTFRQKGRQGYHGITRGLYANEICKLVDPHKRNINELIEQEVLQPMGVKDFRIGVLKGSEMSQRVGKAIETSAHKFLFGVVPRLLLPKAVTDAIYTDVSLAENETQFIRNAIGKDKSQVASQAFTQVWKDGPRSLASYSEHEGWREKHSASTNGFSHGGVLARLANVFAHKGVDSVTGKRILSEQAVEIASTKLDLLKDETLNTDIRYTQMGLSDVTTITQPPPWYSARNWEAAHNKFQGWLGAGGSLIQYSTSHKMSVGYTMNRYAMHIADWRGPCYLAEAAAIAERLDAAEAKTSA
ncbi:beta-lactamase [Sphaeroforma arctica JP610]|uniref:Beta-lactamase n=1 Tax=Sphaeroforma arctica JP610 TaxID=667725 RepID=A0A0L0FLT6_9EUKA|nr:beta-lactamase [Sphaeroforma arctica JP610]KNC77446.1 beta-lactamase [Sphaeroforma arctica JP610]|eukprot:XP_014151348.1 beta-lactamase [Sphaeroforma arctica JP610]